MTGAERLLVGTAAFVLVVALESPELGQGVNEQEARTRTAMSATARSKIAGHASPSTSQYDHAKSIESGRPPLRSSEEAWPAFSVTGRRASVSCNS
jgi:hypothetical protein